MDIVLKYVFSGGQTGADRAGLDAAYDAAIPTGGTAPKYYMTENGLDLALRDKFGLKEGLAGYAHRTMCNVRDTHGTVIFGHVTSVGSAKTIFHCHQLVKPFLLNPTVAELTSWLERKQVHVLNVAGNRASGNPNVYQKTYDTIWMAIHRLRNPGLFK